MSYVLALDTLVETHLTTRDPSTSIAPLTAALGCTFLGYQNQIFEVHKAEQPSLEYESLVAGTLVSALEAHATVVALYGDEDELAPETISILDGLSRNDRWRSCLQDEGRSYDLALALLLMSAESEGSNLIGKLYAMTAPGVVNMLNDWLAPASPLTAIPPAGELARAFFGDVWCEIALVEGGAEVIVPAIRLQRPPFKAGLLSIDMNVHAVPLPTLMTP